MPRTLIIAFGNPLRGDDGLGPALAQRLRSRLTDPSIEILIVHQPLPELAELIAQAEQLLLIDAAVHLPPGQIQLCELPNTTIDPSNFPLTTHHIAPLTLVQLAQVLFGHRPRTWILALGAADFSYRSSPSPAAAQALDQAQTAVERLLQQP